MTFSKKYKRIIISVLVGILGGYLYYDFIGCAGGTCPITSKPLNSTLYGALMGALLVDMLKKKGTTNDN